MSTVIYNIVPTGLDDTQVHTRMQSSYNMYTRLPLNALLYIIVVYRVPDRICCAKGSVRRFSSVCNFMNLISYVGRLFLRLSTGQRSQRAWSALTIARTDDGERGGGREHGIIKERIKYAAQLCKMGDDMFPFGTAQNYAASKCWFTCDVNRHMFSSRITRHTCTCGQLLLGSTNELHACVSGDGVAAQTNTGVPRLNVKACGVGGTHTPAPTRTHCLSTAGSRVQQSFRILPKTTHYIVYRLLLESIFYNI